MDKKLAKVIFIVALFIFLSSVSLYAFPATCTVTRVLDGDSFHCLPQYAIPGARIHKDRTISVRLRGVDAPEKQQPYGVDAKESLKELVGGKTVDLKVKEVDRYGRVVAYVFINNINANLEQIKRGYAWAYAEYLDRPYLSEFYEAEKQARKQRLGLWREINPMPPWEWRKKYR